ncbi:MAG: hypothetical protein Q4C74_09190 [Rothia sp. (in: high G+C Gram-positive bacteria)]|nr:hypothetical protein [Rothia sp. (in: high G+C Gram-positive bacteria)]
MNQPLILLAEEHAERVLLGMPTYWFAIIAGIIFMLGFIITVSFSGRGVVRPDRAVDQLDAQEQQAIKDYRSKHNH